jgi:predicted O-methyltransferase YrrM
MAVASHQTARKPAFEFGSIDMVTKKQQELARTNVERYLAYGYQATKGMSSLFAAKIATSLLLSQTEIGVRGHIAEIGVYKGRFFIALALAIADGERAIAIDAWHDENFYESFSRNLGLQDVPSEIVVTIKGDTAAFDFAYFDSLIGGDTIRFIHVDGDHHRRGLFNDLKIAARKLHDAGIICVDDMFHPCYPLLGDAVQDFLRAQSEFIVFCVIDRNDIVLFFA